MTKNVAKSRSKILTRLKQALSLPDPWLLDEWRDDYEIACICVSEPKFFMLPFFSTNIKHDSSLNFIYFTTRTVPSEQIHIIPKSLLTDLAFLMSAIKFNPSIFSIIDKHLQENEIIINCLKQSNHLWLEHANEKMKDNIKIVSEAISYHHRNFKFASTRLRSDPSIILKTVQVMHGIPDEILEHISDQDLKHHLNKILNKADITDEQESLIKTLKIYKNKQKLEQDLKLKKDTIQKKNKI